MRNGMGQLLRLTGDDINGPKFRTHDRNIDFRPVELLQFTIHEIACRLQPTPAPDGIYQYDPQKGSTWGEPDGEVNKDRAGKQYHQYQA